MEIGVRSRCTDTFRHAMLIIHKAPPRLPRVEMEIIAGERGPKPFSWYFSVEDVFVLTLIVFPQP